MTVGALWDRLRALAVLQGYQPAQDAFDFETQPDTKLDKTYCLQLDQTGVAGYLGGDEAQQHTVVIYLALRAKRDAQGAVRQLLVDLDLLDASVQADETGGVYEYMVVDGTTQKDARVGGDDADFVVGRYMARIEIDVVRG